MVLCNDDNVQGLDRVDEIFFGATKFFPLLHESFQSVADLNLYGLFHLVQVEEVFHFDGLALHGVDVLDHFKVT